jgi:hypothetical protein
MKIIASTRLPEALRTSKIGSLWYAAAGMSIFKGLSGRLWTVSAWPEDIVDIIPTGLVLPDDSYDPLDCAAGRLVVEHADNALVYDLDTGRLVIEVRNYVNESDSLCLTPDGKLLFCFSEEYTSVYVLNDPAAAPHRTEVFNQTGSPPRPKSERLHDAPLLDDPSSARAIPIPGHPKAFNLVIGCYGYVVEWPTSIAPGSPPDIKVTGPPRRFAGKFVYDPVYVEDSYRYPYCFLRHGYGTGLVALDLRTGVLSSCPRSPEPERKPGYSIFWTAIPGPHGESALVQTVDGWMRWLIGAGVESICSGDFTLLRLSEDYVWAIPQNDTATMLKCELQSNG